MRNGLIHIITYTFILVICYVLNEFVESDGGIIALTFMFGWFTYPLIKYLQDER